MAEPTKPTVLILGKEDAAATADALLNLDPDEKYLPVVAENDGEARKIIFGEQRPSAVVLDLSKTVIGSESEQQAAGRFSKVALAAYTMGVPVIAITQPRPRGQHALTGKTGLITILPLFDDKNKLWSEDLISKIDEAVANAAKKPAAAAATPKTQSALVVEDDPDVAVIMAAYLGELGIKSTVVDNAFDAREKLAEQHFDLVVSDRGLKKKTSADEVAVEEKDNKDGVALIAEVTKKFPDTRAMMVTGNPKAATPELQAMGVSTEAVPVMLKSDVFTEFQPAVAKLIAEQAISSAGGGEYVPGGLVEKATIAAHHPERPSPNLA
ncbi:MAG: response regulator [Alphaproteobacteria bacterium]|nr:response regulator [Alphaproteobacteria bacterium]